MKELIELLRKDYDKKTLTFSGGSFIITLIFAAYNGFLGVRYGSLWYGSICIYYLILSLIREFLLLSEWRIEKNGSGKGRPRRTVFLIASGAVFLLNAAMILPVSMMVKLEKPVGITLVPALAMAAYTVYKVVIASVNMKRKSRSDNLIVRELRTINFVDALFSIISLQNTLIVVNSEDFSRNVFILSAISSAAILLAILLIELVSIIAELRRGLRRRNSGEAAE